MGRTFNVIGKPIIDRTIDEVADEIGQLAHELRGTTNTDRRHNLADTIMHLAADIAATE